MYVHGPEHQHLHADRTYPAVGHGRQERHSDRGIRHGLPQEGSAYSPGRTGSRTDTIPPHHDDRLGVCVRRDADVVRHRSRGRQPQGARHGRRVRHGHERFHRHPVRPQLLGLHADPLRETPPQTECRCPGSETNR